LAHERKEILQEVNTLQANILHIKEIVAMQQNYARASNVVETKNGHGFGLHSGALTAKEIGGSLTASSEGTGRGSKFTLELPIAGDIGNSPSQSV
jgi:hypothetical protein